MKFIIRDDDINYHYKAEQLAKWYEGILDICPISICIPAFVKGDFFKWVEIFENHTPYDQKEWLSDGKIYKIGDNKRLVEYLKELLNEKKISLSLHGVYHRNDEMELGEVKKNFIRGAEFYTNRDYTSNVGEAKKYLEDLFGISICSFTPPQNMINLNGFKAIKANDLSLCADYVGKNRFKEGIQMYGLFNFLKIVFYSYGRGRHPHIYPYVINNNNIFFVEHCRLQPGKNIDYIKKVFDYTYRRNGVFVLSTHSYGFDHEMTYYNMTMKEALVDVLHYSQRFENVEYTTLNDLFIRNH